MLVAFSFGGILEVVLETITLYRPVGRAELDLIRGSGSARFPPRLPEQPIFYPVLSERYAVQIARDWNTKDERSGFAGFVLRFRVNSSFLHNYEVHAVGSSEHREYWIPAADLDRFNENIVGRIEVVSEFRRGQTGGLGCRINKIVHILLTVDYGTIEPVPISLPSPTLSCSWCLPLQIFGGLVRRESLLTLWATRAITLGECSATLAWF
jgi:hypothetical protein